MLRDGDVPPQYRVWRREDGSPWRLGGGTAYRATDLHTDEAVALRFFDAPVNGAADKAALARLAQTLSRPGSTHLNALRDLFIRERCHMAVTNFVEGPSLTEGIGEHGTLSSGAVLALAREALEALEALHRFGVAHGSVGPAKLLFVPAEDSLRIVDGGLHRAAVVLAPPEGNAATADDLRRLGMTLWFALTGALPFATGLSAPVGATPDWTVLDALPASEEMRALSALFRRTLAQGGQTGCPQRAGELLNLLEIRGIQRRPGREQTGRGTAGNPAPKSPQRMAGALGLAALAAGLAAAWIVQAPVAQRSGLLASDAVSANDTTTSAPPPEEHARTALPALPPLTGGMPVSAEGIQARAVRIRDVQPATLEVLKNARLMRRAGTLPVSDGRRFPSSAEIERVKDALSATVADTPRNQGTVLVLILGYSDQPTADGGGIESQEEADALAAALFHDGITAPVYACGLGGVDGMTEVDAQAAGDGAFVEVWVAFLLF